MKKSLILITIFIATVYLVNAINLNLNSGEKLENSHWDNLSLVLNKVDKNINDLKINGKLTTTGKICDLNGNCLGECVLGEFFDSSNSICRVPSSCEEVFSKGIGTESGNYTIDTDGVGGNPPSQVYCDKNTPAETWKILDQTNIKSSDWKDMSAGIITSNVYTYQCDRQNSCYNTLQVPKTTSEFVYQFQVGASRESACNDSRWVIGVEFGGKLFGINRTGANYTNSRVNVNSVFTSVTPQFDDSRKRIILTYKDNNAKVEVIDIDSGQTWSAS